MNCQKIFSVASVWVAQRLSVLYRRQLLKSLIDETVVMRKAGRILSAASGHAREFVVSLLGAVSRWTRSRSTPPKKSPLTKTQPDWWFAIWQANGWHNGGNFSKPKPMYVEYATGD